MELNELSKGDRIELHPATDLWMRGARCGDVTSIGRKYVSVKLDRIRRVIRVAPENIGQIITTGTYAGCLVLALALAPPAMARGSSSGHHVCCATHHAAKGSGGTHHSLNYAIRSMFSSK